MAETCKGCAKWEEDIYWNHFQSVSFIQFLTGDFLRQLVIPQKFSANFKNKLPDTVEMKGPSGGKWSIGIVQNNDTLFFKHGWSEFVSDHSLRENDILTFTYNRDSCFRVSVFDRLNLCEKEASYFVRTCEKPRHDSGCSAKRKTRESHMEVTRNSLHEHVECTSPEKSANDDESFILPRGQHGISQLLNRRFQKRARTKSVHSNNGVTIRNKGPSTSAGAVMVKSGAEHSPWLDSQTQYVSNRRPVTEAEKNNALQLAQAAVTDESFMVVLRPTQVYKGFYMAIPTKWLRTHLNPKIQLVTLRVKESTWDVKCYYNANHGIGRLTSGWKNFAVENNLEESDVCVFRAGSLVNNSIVVDVSIFRVVEEVVPPSQRVPGSSSKRGRPPKRAKKQVHKASVTNA